MIIYIASIADFSDLPGLDLISEKRRNNLVKFNNIEDKQRCLLAGLLLRYALGNKTEKIEYGFKGKPFIQGGPCFNLSHSDQHVILGVSQFELGLDVERIDQYKDKLAKRCCTEDEYNWLQTQTMEAFYSLWTGKESIMKATGLGFSLSAGSFSVLPVSNGEHFVNGQCWHMKWLEILDGYALCVSCSVDEPIDVYMLSADEILR